MSIDLNALRRIARGDPDQKVAVRRRWLAEVLKSLEELDRIKTPPTGDASFMDAFKTIFGTGR